MTEMIQHNNQTVPAPEPNFEDKQDAKHFSIVGSGVIGLLTAHELADQGHSVTVYSHEGQPTPNTDSTSAIAIGQFLPWLPEEHAKTVLGNLGRDIGEVVDESRTFFAELAKNPAETGVISIRNVELINDSLPWPEGLPAAMRVEEKPLQQAIGLTDPKGETVEYDKELDFDTFSINTRKTLTWLAATAAAKGVRFEQQHISPEQLHELDGVIINASGMGAKELTRSEDIHHYKGHTILLRPQPGQKVPTEAISVDDLIIMPREDGTVIAGALYRNNPNRPVPERDEAEELLNRLTELAERTGHMVDGLDKSLFEESNILLHSAGYRVVVEPSGIRVAPDEKTEHLLHAYGFSGIGWSVGPVFAKKIAAQAVEIHHKLKGNHEQQDISN